MYGFRIFGLTDKNREAYTAGEFWKALKQKIEALKLKFNK
jgi:hypothetical protein